MTAASSSTEELLLFLSLRLGFERRCNLNALLTLATMPCVVFSCLLRAGAGEKRGQKGYPKLFT